MLRRTKGMIAPPSFEIGLRASLESTPDLKRRGKRILAILDSRPSRRRTRQLDRMQRHAEVELGKIDWSTIDWSKIIEIVLKLLMALLPLLLV